MWIRRVTLLVHVINACWVAPLPPPAAACRWLKKKTALWRLMRDSKIRGGDTATSGGGLGTAHAGVST